MQTVVEKQNKSGIQNFLPDPKSSKIAVAMSGGVDSSVAIYLLKEAGYEVFGITAWLMSGAGRCCDDGLVDAVRVCEELGVEHHAIDLREAFAKGIITDFHKSYQRGETPIPCVSCNNDIKWGHLLEYSTKNLEATHMASGHYAKLVRAEKEFFEVHKAPDPVKDQSYMLWGLTQDQLSKTVFPLGNLTKAEIREIAERANICVAKKPESQDICFVSQGMTNEDYLLKILGEKPGDIVEIESGEVLGQHKGSFNYTYGQRKGIRVAYKEPLYVVKIDSKANIVYVGTKEKLLSQRAKANSLNFLSEELSRLLPEANPSASEEKSFSAAVKIRYNSDPVPAEVFLTSGDSVEIEFKEPVEAVTPGQSAVFYDIDDPGRVLGGAYLA